MVLLSGRATYQQHYNDAQVQRCNFASWMLYVRNVMWRQVIAACVLALGSTARALQV